MKPVFDSKRAKVLVNSLKYGKHYFIAYDGKDEIMVIRNFIKYNNNFIILKTNYIEFFDNKNSFYFYYSDINLNLLFLKFNIINIDYTEENKSILNNKYINYIYFFMIPDLTNIIESDYTKYYNYQISEIMIKNASKYYNLDDEIIFDTQMFLKFSDTNFVNQKKNKDRQYLLTLGGIGDFFITFSIIYDYLENNKCKNVYILNPQSNSNFENIVNLIFNHKVELISFNNKYIYDYWFTNYIAHFDDTLLKEIISIFSTIKEKANSMAFLYEKCLLKEKNIDYYQYNYILKEQLLNNVSNEEINYINYLIENKKNNIGLQYFTGFFDSETNTWKSFGNRIWDVTNIQEFIKLCKKNGINLIILNSETYDESLQEFCTKKLSLAGYALLISKMDLIVGVDSSAGHIASFYNIPSITLWGRGSPLIYYYNTSYIGYRPLRKNYSIIAKNQELSSIDYITVFSLVEKFFINDLKFEDKIITYQDSLNEYNMLYL